MKSFIILRTGVGVQRYEQDHEKLCIMPYANNEGINWHTVKSVTCSLPR